MPLAAHAKDNGRDSEYGHDDASRKEIAILVGATLKWSLRFHDESRISRLLRYRSISLDIGFSQCNGMPCGEPRLRTSWRAKWDDQGSTPLLKSNCVQSISLLVAQRAMFFLPSGMSNLLVSMQVPVKPVPRIIV